MFSSYVAVSYKQMGKTQKQLAEGKGRIINTKMRKQNFIDESRVGCESLWGVSELLKVP